MKRILCASAISLAVFSLLTAQTASRRSLGAGGLPSGYWPLEKSQAIIEKTQVVRLAPDLSHLSAAERAAMAKLLEVGKIFQEIHEEQLHAGSA